MEESFIKQAYQNVIFLVEECEIKTDNIRNYLKQNSTALNSVTYDNILWS